MEKKPFVVLSDGRGKKYALTFIIALIVAVVVIAIFSLVTNRHSDEWLGGDSGAARETMFPFAFTSGDSLYVLDKDLKINPVDDSVENAVHDAGLSKLYYTREGVLYEYSIDSNTRRLLCSGVNSFKLFKERRSIAYIGEDGGLYFYLYNERVVKKLKDVSDEDMIEDSGFISGKEHIAYRAEYNKEKGTSKLYVSDLLGNTKCIAEDVNVGGGVYIWEDDSAISYYKKDSLIISNIDGKVLHTLKNSAVVLQTANNYAVESCTKVSEYGDAKKIKYITTEVSEDGSKATLQYAEAKNGEVSLKCIATDIKGIVHYSGDENIIVYTTEKTDKELNVFLCRKGADPKKITSCKIGTDLHFDVNSCNLFLMRSEKKLSYINTYDKDLCEIVLSEDAGSVYPYVNKPFVVFHNSQETMHTILLKNNNLESFSAKEARLYGKYDDEYLMCRSNEDGIFSLDYVKNGKFTRISGDVSRNVIFDKSLKNVVYLSNGELFIWQRKAAESLGEFPEGITALTVFADK